MIYIRNIRDLCKGNSNQWLIVRSANDISEWMIHVPALSPSKNLFFKYLNLKEKGQWGRKAFEEIYVPIFLKDIKSNMDNSKNMLNQVYKMDKNGIDITMACFCPFESLCHRCIIAGLLMGVGCNVDVMVKDNDYIKYYEMYKKL